MNTPTVVAPIDAKGVYRRLLGYARPHLGMFLIGVVGMALFAATGPAFAWLVQNFVDLGFVKKDPSVLWLVPLGAPLLFLLRGLGDYIGVYFPGLRVAADHQGHAPRPVPAVPAISRRSTTTGSRPARCCRGSRSISSRSPKPPPIPPAR